MRQQQQQPGFCKNLKMTEQQERCFKGDRDFVIVVTAYDHVDKIHLQYLNLNIKNNERKKQSHCLKRTKARTANEYVTLRHSSKKPWTNKAMLACRSSKTSSLFNFSCFGHVLSQRTQLSPIVRLLYLCCVILGYVLLRSAKCYIVFCTVLYQSCSKACHLFYISKYGIQLHSSIVIDMYWKD